ncbi:MAG: hypothetical protein ACKVX7_06230 [Planctomycetota bacterium]
MRALNIQIQPERMKGGDPEELVARLRDATDGVQLQFVAENRGDENGLYINLNFCTTNFVAGWRRLRGAYDDSDVGRQLESSTIATCEGSDGWNDYLLLHHFNPDEKTDDVDC